MSYRLFKNKSMQVAVVLPNGSRVDFLNHKYLTKNSKEIEFLEAYAENQECGVYFDAEDTKVAEKDLGQIREDMVPFRRRSLNYIPNIGARPPAVHPGTSFQSGVASTAHIVSGNVGDTIKVSGGLKDELLAKE